VEVGGLLLAGGGEKENMIPFLEWRFTKRLFGLPLKWGIWREAVTFRPPTFLYYSFPYDMRSSRRSRTLLSQEAGEIDLRVDVVGI
jgi:hypothetical protein